MDFEYPHQLSWQIKLSRTCVGCEDRPLNVWKEWDNTGELWITLNYNQDVWSGCFCTDGPGWTLLSADKHNFLCCGVSVINAYSAGSSRSIQAFVIKVLLKQMICFSADSCSRLQSHRDPGSADGNEFPPLNRVRPDKKKLLTLHSISNNRISAKVQNKFRKVKS